MATRKQLPTLSPLALAVEPVREKAIERAEQDTRRHVEKLLARVAEHGWDLEKAAPYPSSRTHGAVQYKAAVRYRQLIQMITRAAPGQPGSHRVNDPYFVVACPERIEEFVAQARRMADEHYTAFVAKMEDKVGPHDAASLEGEHVWSTSYLTITKGSAKEVWKTQQIVNVSVLGLLFNQWPSRKVKR